MTCNRANLESNRASKRWQEEKNSVARCKMRLYELNLTQRESLAREFRTNGTAANVTY